MGQGKGPAWTQREEHRVRGMHAMRAAPRATPGQGSSKPCQQERSRASPGRPKAVCLKHSVLVQRLSFPLIKTRFKRQRKAKPVPADGFVLTTPPSSSPATEQQRPAGSTAGRTWKRGCSRRPGPEGACGWGVAHIWESRVPCQGNRRPGSGGAGNRRAMPKSPAKTRVLPTNRQGRQPVQ